MKRVYCTGALCLSVLLGAARAADLIANTDAKTGFLRFGGVVPRYICMLLCVLLIFLAGHAIPSKQSSGLRAADGTRMRKSNFLLIPPAFCCGLYGLVYLLNRIFGKPVSAVQASRHAKDNMALYTLWQIAYGVRAALFLLFSIWCLWLFFENLTRSPSGKGALVFGTLCSMALYLHTLLCFLERPSSLYRILPVVNILSSLSALLFITALLRALYLPRSPDAARILCRSGLLSFFFCTCLGLPQTMWQVLKGMEAPVSLALAVGFGCLGLVGADCARCAAAQPNPAAKAPGPQTAADPEAPGPQEN